MAGSSAATNHLETNAAPMPAAASMPIAIASGHSPYAAAALAAFGRILARRNGRRAGGMPVSGCATASGALFPSVAGSEREQRQHDDRDDDRHHPLMRLRRSVQRRGQRRHRQDEHRQSEHQPRVRLSSAANRWRPCLRPPPRTPVRAPAGRSPGSSRRWWPSPPRRDPP